MTTSKAAAATSFFIRVHLEIPIIDSKFIRCGMNATDAQKSAE
jgi:hypothetical protein